MMADTDWPMRVVQYGYGSDAAIYSIRCPVCGRYTKAEAFALVNEVVGAGPAFGACARDGRVQLSFVCWRSDTE